MLNRRSRKTNGGGSIPDRRTWVTFSSALTPDDGGVTEVAKSKNPKHCECGNVRHPGEQTCPNCQELDQHRRKIVGVDTGNDTAIVGLTEDAEYNIVYLQTWAITGD